MHEAHIQALIAILELAHEGKPASPENLRVVCSSFRKYREDWGSALAELVGQGLLTAGATGYALTARGQSQAKDLRAARPPMWYWYREYYEAAPASPAYSIFCRRAFGLDLCQHGFADLDQLRLLLQVTCLGTRNRALDLGCGNGGISEYLSEASGAHVTGVDYIPEAIRQAQDRTSAKRSRLEFRVGDIADPSFPPGSFDALISIDTAYFVELKPAIARWRELLSPGGQMAFLYSQGADPETPIERFDRDTLPADNTPLGIALMSHDLPFRTWDLTQADYRHAHLKKQVLDELKAEFEAEGNSFLFDNRYGEALGVMAAVEAGAHARYLYLVRT